MMTETVIPGSRVWVLDEHMNSIAEKTVTGVEINGVRFKDRTWPLNWSQIYASREAAVAAMLARAAQEVKNAERQLANAKAAEVRLRRKYQGQS